MIFPTGMKKLDPCIYIDGLLEAIIHNINYLQKVLNARSTERMLIMSTFQEGAEAV